jgi:hypothetical protein
MGTRKESSKYMFNKNSIVNVVESTIKDGASQKLSNVVVMYMFQIHVVVNVGSLVVKWMFQTYYVKE